MYLHICIYVYTYMYICVHRSAGCATRYTTMSQSVSCDMGWLRLVGSLKLQLSFAKEPYKRDDILQKRPVNLRGLLIVATPYLL